MLTRFQKLVPRLLLHKYTDILIIGKFVQLQVFLSMSTCRGTGACRYLAYDTLGTVRHFQQSHSDFQIWRMIILIRMIGLITRYLTYTRQYPWPQFLFSISCEKDSFKVLYISECSVGSMDALCFATKYNSNTKDDQGEIL